MNPWLHLRRIWMGFLFICFGGLGFSSTLNAQTYGQDLLLEFSYRPQIEHENGPLASIKCLTPILAQPSTDSLLQSRGFVPTAFENSTTLSQVLLDQQFISESGRFIIHYTTSGSDAVPPEDQNSNTIPDFVEWAAIAADSSYQVQITELGYPDPIPSGARYDIYLKDLSGFGAYGLTNTSRFGIFPCGANTTKSCIYSENDFVGYPPNTHPTNQSRGALEVTIAHEFKHAIQYLQNEWSGETDDWAEMDATLMEEVVYDEVNDYYNYIENFSSDLFQRAYQSLIPGSYEDITFALYFHEHLGPEFWPETWRLIEQDNELNFLDAVRKALEQRGLSYATSLSEAYAYHYASGEFNSPLDYGFDERNQYPNPRIEETITELVIGEAFIDGDLSRLSSRFYEIALATDLGTFAQVNLSADNADVVLGVLIYETTGGVQFHTLESDGMIDQFTELPLGVNWTTIEKIGLMVTQTSSNINAYYKLQIEEYSLGDELILSQNYPNPAKDYTKIDVWVPKVSDLNIELFDLLGRKVKTIYQGSADAGSNTFGFATASLSSGVYIYRVIGAGNTASKAIHIIR